MTRHGDGPFGKWAWEAADASLITRAAKSLITMKLAIGDRIGCWSPGAIEDSAISAAAFRVGLSVVHFAAESDPATVHAHIETFRPRLMFVRAFHEGVQYPALLRAMRLQIGTAPAVIVHGREDRFKRVLSGGWEAFLDSGDSVDDDHLTARMAETISVLNDAAEAAILVSAMRGALCTGLSRKDVRASRWSAPTMMEA